MIGAHPEHGGAEGLAFPGIHVQTDFISAEEEKALTCGFDGLDWDTSQSGRRKQVAFVSFSISLNRTSYKMLTHSPHQNYGPRTNFKKMKLAAGKFNGFPEYSQFVQERFNEVALLRDYRTIEQCSLEYDPDKGASIDPHIDDCWIWGEREWMRVMRFAFERTNKYVTVQFSRCRDCELFIGFRFNPSAVSNFLAV